MDDAHVTRIYFDSGQFVRCSEQIGEVGMMLEDNETRWLPVTDPGDERAKLVDRRKVAWVEMERDDG
jgi:hypothetical protein